MKERGGSSRSQNVTMEKGGAEICGHDILLKEGILQKIYTIRGVQVMLDSDLAELYRVETKNLNRGVKRNIGRFPKEFMFQLTKEEFDNSRFQNGTSGSAHGGRRYLPYAFTEQGVAMLSAVLRSDVAVEISGRGDCLYTVETISFS